MVKVAPNPFTPQSGLEPKILGGRDGLVEEFVHLLEKRKKGSQLHLLMLGEWGVGKTSLLKFYKKVAQNLEFKAVYVSVPRSSSRDSYREVLSSLLEEISFGLGREFNSESKNRLFSRNPSLALTDFLVENFKFQDSQLLLVLVDDIQNICEMPQVLDILRLSLSSEKLLEEANYLFVLASTPSGWRSFLERHNPIGRFFRTKQMLDKLSYQDLDFTIRETLLNTGVKFSGQIIANCWHYTQGHPYELQLLASHLYDNQHAGIVDEECWEIALINTLKDLGVEYFASLYNKASEREKELLNIFAEKKQPLGISEIREIMILERKVKGFPIANIKNFLYRLEDKGLLRREEDKRYHLLDNMFAEYIFRFG